MSNLDWTVAAMIFLLRMTDVALGTMRVMYMVRGQRFRSATLGLIESSIFIFAISRIFQNPDAAKMLGYAGGYAAGNFLGVTIEGWIASGHLLYRVISRTKSDEVGARLRERGFGVTSLRGEGRAGTQTIHFVVSLRRRNAEILRTIQEVDPEAFITIDSVQKPIGGHLPVVAEPMSVRK